MSQMSNGHLSIGQGIDEFCRTLVHEAPDAIVYADVGGMIRFWNRGAERLFGFSASEVLGKSLDMIIPQQLRKRHWEAYGKAMQSGQTRYGAGDTLAVPALRKDGTQVPVEFTILLFRDREGHNLGAAAILRDASKRQEEIEALRKELAVLQSAENWNAAPPEAEDYSSVTSAAPSHKAVKHHREDARFLSRSNLEPCKKFSIS